MTEYDHHDHYDKNINKFILEEIQEWNSFLVNQKAFIIKAYSSPLVFRHIYFIAFPSYFFPI